jgi:hypothetical protein
MAWGLGNAHWQMQARLPLTREANPLAPKRCEGHASRRHVGRDAASHAFAGLSFTARASAAGGAAREQSPEKSAACVGDEIASGGPPFLLLFLLKTGADKFVDLIGDVQVPLVKLSVNIVAWIGVPDKPRDLDEHPTVPPEAGVARLQQREGRTAHPSVF